MLSDPYKRGKARHFNGNEAMLQLSGSYSLPSQMHHIPTEEIAAVTRVLLRQGT